MVPALKRQDPQLHFHLWDSFTGTGELNLLISFSKDWPVGLQMETRWPINPQHANMNHYLYTTKPQEVGTKLSEWALRALEDGCPSHLIIHWDIKPYTEAEGELHTSDSTQPFMDDDDLTDVETQLGQLMVALAGVTKSIILE